MNKSILGLFAENEAKVAKLYEIFSRKISGYKGYWTKMAKEEFEHTKLLEKLEHDFQGGDEYFDLRNYSKEIIENIGYFLDVKIREAKIHNLSQNDALEIALRIEQSMLEDKSFEIFHPKEKRITKIFLKLNQDTKQHMQKLKKEFEKI